MSTEILTSGCSFKCQPKIAPLQTSTPKTDQNFSDVGIFAELRISKKTDFLAKMAIWIKSVKYFLENSRSENFFRFPTSSDTRRCYQAI